MQTNSTRHRPGLKRLDIDLGLLGSTSAWAWTTRHLRPVRLDIDPGPLGSKIGLGLLGSTQAWPGQLDIGSGPDDSTSIRARSTWHRPGLERLDIESGSNDSTSIRVPSASTRARSFRHQLGPTRLNIGLGTLSSTSSRARPKQLDINPDPNDSTTTQGRNDLTTAQPGRLDIGPGPD